MVRVKLNEFVPEPTNGTPKVAVTLKYQLPFLAELDRQAKQYMVDQCQHSSQRREACKYVLAGKLWDISNINFLNTQQKHNVSLSIGSPISQGWQNSLRSNVVGGTADATAGSKKTCGLQGSIDFIEKKDGAKHRDEYIDALDDNIRDEDRWIGGSILAAIRHAEDGDDGKEYGVTHVKAWATDYRTQAGWAAATTQKCMDRWRKGTAGPPPVPAWEPYLSNPTPPHPGTLHDPADVEEFLEWYAKIYAPIGAADDPTNLNQHWYGNVLSKWKQLYYCEPPG